MRWKRRCMIRCAVFLCVAGVIVGLFVLSINMRPIVRELAAAKVENRAQSVINEAVELLLNSGEIDYSNIVYLEKDIYGNVTALRTNIAEVNRVKTEILSATDQMLLDLDVNEIGLPLGSVIFPTYFSGSGPRIPIRVLSISNSDADYCNRFSEAGINQTSHQIMMNVIIHMTILTPVGTENVEVSSSVVVAETVIVGSVPQSYMSLGE